MVSPWLNAAESYTRGNDYKAENWVSAVGQTLGIAYADPSNSNSSDLFFEAAKQAGTDLLIGGAMHVLNKNAGDTYLENAVGQDIGTYLGPRFVSALSTNKPTSRSAEDLEQEAEQVRAANNQREYTGMVDATDEQVLQNIANTKFAVDIPEPTLDIASVVSTASAGNSNSQISNDLNLNLDLNRMVAISDPELAKSFWEVNALNRQAAALDHVAQFFGSNNSQLQNSEVGIAAHLQNWLNGARASDQEDYTNNILNATNPVSAISNTYLRALNNAGYDVAQLGVGVLSLATDQDARNRFNNAIDTGLSALSDHPIDVLGGLYNSSRNYLATNDVGQIGEDLLRFGAGGLATGGIGKGVGVVAGLSLDAASSGARYFLENFGTGPVGPSAMRGAVGDLSTGNALVQGEGPYGDLAGSLDKGFQAHHLNQNAAFSDVIPKDEGFAIGIRGNAFTDLGTPHYDFHSSLEGFWNQYRIGGDLFGDYPTNAQYGEAVTRALQDAGLSSSEAQRLSDLAAQNRTAYGLSPNVPVPRIPNRLYQSSGN
jgi:hypothetical protein